MDQKQTAPPPYAATQGVPQGYPPQQQQYQQQYAQPPMQQGYVQQGYVQQPAGYVQQPVAAQTGVVVVQQQQTGNCPSCRNGFLVDDYSVCGIILAIVFFPIGLLCCLAMRDRRCTNCNARY